MNRLSPPDYPRVGSDNWGEEQAEGGGSCGSPVGGVVGRGR